MKNLMIAFALILGLNAAQAQKRSDLNNDGQTRNRAKTERSNFNKDPEARAKAKVERLDKELKLSATQKASIQSFVLDQANKQKALYKNADHKSEDVRAQIKEMNGQTDRKILDVLDANQKQKYAEFQQKRADRKTNKGQHEAGDHASHS